MSIMNKIVYEEIDECVVLYIDDMLIYFKSELDQMWDLRRVLKKLRLYNLYANAEKNKNSLRQLGLLDHVFSGNIFVWTLKKFQRAASRKYREFRRQ